MSIEYHRGELLIALDPDHPDHILPPALPPAFKLLDVGCGAGQTLVAAYPDRPCVGLDIDFEALDLGRTLTSSVKFVNGCAEALPFKGGEFDAVIARVSLPYTDLATSLKEIRRVLCDGGEVWMTLHPLSISLKQALQNGWKAKIFFCYVLLNSLCFHFWRWQFPYFNGRYESFQTTQGMRRALKESGFDRIEISRSRHFVVKARAALEKSTEPVVTAEPNSKEEVPQGDFVTAPAVLRQV